MQGELRFHIMPLVPLTKGENMDLFVFIVVVSLIVASAITSCISLFALLSDDPHEGGNRLHGVGLVLFALSIVICIVYCGVENYGYVGWVCPGFFGIAGIGLMIHAWLKRREQLAADEYQRQAEEALTHPGAGLRCEHR